MARHNQMNQPSEELAELQKDDARRTTPRPSRFAVVQNKQKETERAGKEPASGIDKRAQFSAESSEKNESPDSCRRKQPDESEPPRDAMDYLERELLRDRAAYRKRVDEMIQRAAEAPIILGPGVRESEAYDFFLSYASEDREDLVCELAECLRAKGARVWYDEFVLKVGDSLRRKIEHGLANSLYGVVVLSPNFFAKEWTKKELEILISIEADGERRILPTWHKIPRHEVARNSPMLLDRVGLHTSEYMPAEIAEKLMEAKELRPKRGAVKSGQAPI